MDGAQVLSSTKLFSRYQSHITGVPVRFAITPSFKNYISWLAKQDLEKAAAFWKNELEGFETTTPLGIGTIQQSGAEAGYGAFKYDFSETLSARVFDWTKDAGITVNILVQGAWSILLGCYSGEQDVVFGATVSGRPPELKNVETMVGLFINSLPVRVNTGYDGDIISWLRELQASNNNRMEYSYTPLVDIKKASEVTGISSLFDSLLVFENYPFDGSGGTGLHGLEISNIQSVEETNYPITLMIIPKKGTLHFQLNYFKDRFTEEEIATLFSHLENIVHSIINDATQKPSQVSLMGTAERNKVLVQFNDTYAPVPKEQTVFDLIARQLKSAPDSIALFDGPGQSVLWRP